VPNFRDSPVFVVGRYFDQHGYSPGTVSFVNDLKDLGFAIKLASATLDSTFDIILGHVCRTSLIDDKTQSKVRIGIRSAFFGSNYNFAC